MECNNRINKKKDIYLFFFPIHMDGIPITINGLIPNSLNSLDLLI